jgi:hypothetical protein
MDNNIKFTVTVDKLNRMISELNIKISKDVENADLRNKLNELISDKNTLYKGSAEEYKKIIEKYGDNANG